MLKMANENFQKYLCFSKDLTLATRLIAFLGLVVSMLLVTVLIHDMSAKNFDLSRKIALALGLDWRHIHSKANPAEKADPNGKVISAMLIIYAIVFFATNVSLTLGSIVEKPCFAVPWLISEFVSCLSKLVALIFHVVTEVNDLNEVFIVGSLIYLLVILWWWLVVYTAQSIWREAKQSSLQVSSSINETGTEFNSILLNSPEPYRANRLYTSI